MVDRFNPNYNPSAMQAMNRHDAGAYVRFSDYEALRVRLETVEARLERKLRACQWYWPEDDTSSEACADSAQEVVQSAYEYDIPTGDIIAVARGGVVDVAYCAYLPPADDSDSDDDFWVEEETREAAKKKIDAELARRALSQEG